MKSIKIANNTYVHVFLHKINVSLQEAVISSETEGIFDFEKMANDYIDALEDHYCVAFLEELHKVCAQRIVQHWEEFAPHRLEEKYYESYLKLKGNGKQ